MVNNLLFGCQEALISSTQIIEADLIIPNAFSPDGDGINDTWEIQGLYSNEGYTLTVFNRWQNVVYRTTQYENDWAGWKSQTSNHVWVVMKDIDNNGRIDIVESETHITSSLEDRRKSVRWEWNGSKFDKIN